jgi:hypothetical protein
MSAEPFHADLNKHDRKREAYINAVDNINNNTMERIITDDAVNSQAEKACRFKGSNRTVDAAIMEGTSKAAFRAGAEWMRSEFEAMIAKGELMTKDQAAKMTYEAVEAYKKELDEDGRFEAEPRE